MRNTVEDQSSRAEIASLKRRLRVLEKMMTGDDHHHSYTRHEILSLYIDARFGSLNPSDREAKLWAYVSKRMDEASLLDLALTINDPFPWRTFLCLLDSFDHNGYGDLVEEAQAHLLDVAASLLKAQGLAFLRPEDVIRTPLGVEQAISAYQRHR